MAHWLGIGIPRTNAIALEVTQTHTHTHARQGKLDENGRSKLV